MTPQALLEELDRLDIKVWVSGEKLSYDAPRGAVTPELLARIKECKPELLAQLRTGPKALDETIEFPADVLTIARETLPPLKDEDRVNLQELLQANKPPEPGRDSMTKHDTDKAHFFQAPADCSCDVCMPLPRYATRRDGRAYRGGQA
jgi:hypothetical protein